VPLPGIKLLPPRPEPRLVKPSVHKWKVQCLMTQGFSEAWSCELLPRKTADSKWLVTYD